jgi:predicted outer membrane repeat protein
MKLYLYIKNEVINMNKKQIFIVLCLFIISLLAVSAVSAADNADDLNISATADNQEIIQVSNTQEDILTDSAGTFTQLDDQIQGASANITLDKNYTYASDDSRVSSGISIDKDITIDGAGYTIDGANQASIFDISGGSHVVLKNINFVNAKGSDGAALRFTASDNVEIFNCNFINNSASGEGGAIYIGSASITSTSIISEPTFKIADSKFIDNTAGDDGGAIYVENASGIIDNITCINNKGISIDKPNGDTSSTRGGTICLTGDNVVISQSSFTSGSAWMADGKDASKVDGGALFITGDNVHIINTTFDDCSATHDGGAIYIIGSNTLIDNCTFDNCTSTNKGGAIYVQGSDATINNSAFTNNYATLDGGSIYVEGNDTELYNTIFINNIVGDDGGAIYWEGNRGIMYNITCTNNKGVSANKPDGDTSSTRGGTICLTGDDVVISESSFTSSSAWMADGKDASKVDGGALFITGNNVNITDTTFDDCNATHGGGAIYIIGNNTTILGCTLNDCSAIGGGSICIEGHDAHIFQSNITNSLSFEAGGVYVKGPNTVISANFINCTAGDEQNQGSGGAIYVDGVNTNIIESTFLNSTAYGGDGGAVYVGGFNTTIQKSDFKFTSADDGKGGAIYIAGDSANVLDSTFSDAHAEYGGAIYIGGYLTGSDAKVLDCNITSTTSGCDGGAIYVAGNRALISANIKDTRALGLNAGNGSGGAIYVGGDYSNITASTFENCSAGLDSFGGAIYIDGNDANVEKSTFHNTYAIDGAVGASGGAIYIAGDDAVVSESEFSECYAREGGVIFVEGRYAKVKNSNMTDSYAFDNGGAVYISGGIFTDISDSTFNNCSAENNDGGAIYIDGYVTTIRNSEFTNCIAGSENGAGGAIYIEGNNATVTNAVFDSCVSVDGGAIYIQGDNAGIYESEFTGNKLVDYTDDDNYGGAIYVNGASAVISASKFENHSAFTGGSIYINGKDTTILDSNFTKSTADYGGAIFIQGENAKILSSDINDCSCNYDGGAIYVNGTNALISADFTNCNAGSEETPDIAGNGGAIYVRGTNAKITDSTFQNCIAANDGDGGAIFVAGINTHVENSKFDNSHARDGGAIYIEGASATVYGSQFENTHAYDGGAIYIEGNDTKIQNVDVSSSYTTHNGGAIYVHGVRTLVEDSTFAKTHTLNDGVGGAIEIVGENTTIRDSNFTDSNSAAGGAIYVTGDNAEITGSHFSDISSATSGGAIYVAGDNTKISDDTFASCHSQGTTGYSGGGAIYVAGDGTDISDSKFTGSTSQKFGGAIYVAGRNTNIAGSEFTSNYAADSAGAIYISKYSEKVNGKEVVVEAQNTVITDCSFYKNSAVNAGGAVRVSGTNTTINRSQFNQNKVTFSRIDGDSRAIGGALYINGVNATVQYSAFTENTCNGKGGAVFWYGGHGGDSIIGCNFTRNSANHKDQSLGGGVYWSVGDKLTPGGLVKDTIFDSNYAGKHGGGMDWFRSLNSVMENCTFINNEAFKDGGAFYIGDTGGKSKNMTLTNCKFINNTANYAGGAISIQMSDSHFINSTFEGNKAKFGGSIIIKDGVTVNNEIIGCTFINSLAQNDTSIEAQVRGKGGAIFARDNSIKVDNSTFINCTALEGGAIYWNGGMNYKNTDPSSLHGTKYLGLNGVVSNSKFINNTAVRGGAVYWQATNGTISNSNFTGNDATEGGALYWEGGVEYMDVKFNYPKTFVVHGENGKVYNSTFTANTAQNGGAAYWTGTNGKIVDSTFIENEANKGGAVYWNNITQTATYSVYSKTVSAGQNGLLSNCEFFNNHAEGSDAQGGALYWNTSSSNVADAKFQNNTATLGGAIYWVNGESINGSTFRYNKADNGSAMYVDESSPRMDIVDSTFFENRAKANRFDPLIWDVDEDDKTVTFTAYFRGNDNIINAIFNDGENNVYFTDVSYLGVNGVKNTGKVAVSPEKIDGIPEDPEKFYQTDYEVYQTVDVTIYGANNKELDRVIAKTDSEGKISLFYDNLDVDKASLKLKIQHPEDDYYTYLVHAEGANLTSVFIETADIYCLDDEIINITVVPQDESIMVAPTGNISLWIGDKLFAENVQLTNEEGSRCATATVIVPRCPTGTYNVYVKYNGDDDFLPEENSSSFNVLKIDDDIIVETVDIKVGEIEPINITVFPSDKVTGEVMVWLDGKYLGKYNLTDGKIQINQEGLLKGKHYVTAHYLGDSYFDDVMNESSFMVTKHDPYFIVNANDIFVYDNGFIWVILPENATGYVFLKVNGTEYYQQYYINLTNGERNITIPPLDVAGIYDVWGYYSGDDYWNDAVNTTTFKVSKYNITLDVQTADIVYGETEQLNVTLEFSDATGNVTIRINDTLRVFENVPIVNGVARINVTGLVPGNYVVDVSYPGDKKYNGNVTKGNFTVGKAHIPIIIEPQNFTFLETGTAYIYVNTNGVVNATIAGVAKNNRTLLDGSTDYDLKDLVPGIYTITAHFFGNQYYYEDTNETTFEVYKLNRTVDVKVHDIVYGNYEDIKVFVNATGNVTIFVNDEIQTVVLIDPGYGGQGQGSVGHYQSFNGQAPLNVFNLPVGTYPVEVIYNGDMFYNPAYGNAVFRVIPANVTLSINAEDIKVWDDEHLDVTVKDARGNIWTDASGNITINIEGATYSAEINNGVARFVIPDLAVGDKEVWAFYEGDRNHNGNKSRATFNVGQRTPVVNVTGQDINVGKTEHVHIEIPSNATGYVILTGSFIDNPIQITEFNNGKADVEFNGLAVGNYTVHIKYYGEEYDNYTVGEADGTFEVSSINTPIEIVVESIFYKQTADITVNVNDDASGIITINVVNESGIIREIKLPVFNGTVNWLVDNLAVDNYTVYAYYSGDGRYNANETDNLFEVQKIAPTITIESVDVDVGTNATVVVHITSGTTGGVDITVNGKEYSGQIDDGIVRIIIDQLSSGNYTVYAYYAGDRNYTDASNSTDNAVIVHKVGSYDMDVTAVDTKVGLNTTIVVTVPSDAEGEVAIYVNGTWVGNANINQGIAKLTNVTQDISGPYVVIATFSDDKYANNNASTKYYVSKWDTPIVITVENETNIHVGDVVKIIVSVPDDVKDNVTIEIDGKSYTNKTYGGNAVFYVPGLSYGDKTVVATYEGDNKYVFNSTTADFPVMKYDLTITVTGINIPVGDVEVITVEVSGDVTRPVLVDVDGQGYYVNITEGKGTLEITGLDSGFYNITAKYLGDDKYNGAKANNSFIVSKVPSTVTVTAEDITVGDKEIIEIRVPADATGIVFVTVDGKLYDVSVANGKGILVVSDLKVGNYTVDVRYPGDRKYESSENSTVFKVSPKNSEIIVIDKGNNTVEVIVGDNATGNVTITVDGQNFTGKVTNGTAVITVDNITPGVHNITVIYSGDENHTGATENGTITVPGNETQANPAGDIPVIVSKDDIIINVGSYDIYVGDTELINVTLSDDAAGNVFIEINGRIYEPVDVDMNVVRFVVENLTAGGKTVVAYYTGDDNYFARNVTDRFTVSKHDSTVTAEIKDIYVGENVIVVVNVIEDATGQVLIDIDGVTYYTNVTNGIGFVEIPRMLSGTYPVNLTYVGDDKYLPSYNTTSFRVSKVPSFVIPIAEDIYVGELENILLSVPADAVGNVTVVIDGEIYNFNLADGVLAASYVEGEKYVVAISGGNGVLVLSGLPEGEYVVSARYNGDDKYLPSVNDTTFIVYKVEVPEIVPDDNTTVNNESPENDTENITSGEVEVPEIVRDENTTVNNVQSSVNDTENLTYVDTQDYLVPIGNEDDVAHAEHFEGNKNKTAAEEPVNEEPVSEGQESETPMDVISHDIYVGETETISVQVPSNATGTITIEIDGVKYSTTEINEGIAVFEVEGLTAGEKTVFVNYSGDGKYPNNSTAGKFTVNKLPSTVNATGQDIEVDEDEIIEIVVPSDATGTITVEIDGVKYSTSEIVNGKAQIVIPDLPAGTYTAKVFYEGNDKYLPSNTTITFEVSEIETPIDDEEEEQYDDNDTELEDDIPSNETSIKTITYKTAGEKEVHEDKEVHAAEKAHASEGVALSQHETGNPILALLLVLLVAGSSQIRRRFK